MTNQLLFKYKTKGRFLSFLVSFFAFVTMVSAQNISVTGTVSDNQGPLPGVTVVVKGTNTGTATDFDGNYILNVPSDGVLVFSFVGFTSQEIPVNGQSVVNATLREDLQQLDEVVIVGYGSMERANVTGAITSIKTEEIAKAPVPNIVEALRGQIPGLRVTRGGGQPGSGVNFTIRGTNSLGEGSDNVDDANQPILVIDGVPLPGGNLAEINPADIATINVLKDAAAASIYGSSGANGVILITTKNGQTGRASFTVNASSGFTDLSNRLNMMGPDEYIRYLQTAATAVGNPTTLSAIMDQSEIDNYIEGKETDWQDILLRTGTVNNISLSMSGGTEKLHFYLNGDMYKETGIVTNSDYERYSVRFNSDYSPYEWLKVGARVQLTKSFADETSNSIDIDGNGTSDFVGFVNNTPLGDVYDENGNLTPIVKDDQFQQNPLFKYKESQIDRVITRSYINPYIDVNILPGLKYTLNTFAESRDEFLGVFRSSKFDPLGAPSEAQTAKATSTNYLVDNILNYTKDFGKHNINATFVYGFQNNEYEQIDARAEDLPTDLLGYNAIGDAPSESQRFNWETDEWGKVYLVGRLGYAYDRRYSLTMTLRRDGSSRFGENTRYGTFPSISGAWNIQNENFWGSDPVVSLLKLRGSYGTLGNDRVSTYSYLANSQVVQIALGTEIFVGYGPGTVANPDLKWETSKQLNVGVDYGFLNDRLTGSLDYYKTETDDLLLVEQIPGLNGATSVLSNIGKTENWGIDASLSARIFDGEFSWDATINWAKDENKIVSLTRGDVNEAGEPVDDPANGWFIGQDIREIFDYEYLGVYQLGEEAEAASYGFVPGNAKIRDVNEDGVIDADDRTFLGNPTPDWYGGFRNTFSYKGFELTVLFEAVEGVTRVNGFYGNYAGARSNAIDIDYWTPTNPTNAFPMPTQGVGFTEGRFNNAVKVQDASFISLRNVSLSYSLPKEFLDKTPFSALTFYARGNNLKYFTKLDDAYSPETAFGVYPTTRSYTFGTTLTF